MYITEVTKFVGTNLDFNYNSTSSVSGAGKLSVNQLVPTATTGARVNFTFDIVTGRFLAFASTPGSLELRSNATGAGPISTGNRFFLSPGNNLIYDEISTARDSFGSGLRTISGLFVYNSGSIPSTLRIDSLFDPTPTI
jgi:hypothetical protein